MIASRTQTLHLKNCSLREREMMDHTFRKVKAYAPLPDERAEYPFVR